MSSELIHPDEGVIKVIPRDAESGYFIYLPRLQRQGLKQISLPVPIALADKLSKGTTNSATQAIAVVARWVLEDLHRQSAQLIADPTNTGFAFRLLPRDEEGITVRVYGQPVAKGTRSMLASLPPSLHEQLRSLGDGTIRSTLLALLQYGVEQLEIFNKSLKLTKLETDQDGAEGKSAILLVDGNGSNEQWISEALPVMRWLGYQVKVAQVQDMQQASAVVCAGILVVGKPNEAVQDWLSSQKHDQVFHYEPVLDAAGDFSPEGVLSRHKRQEFMSKARSDYCVQCDRGVSEIEVGECNRDADQLHGRMYCRACRSLFGPRR